MQDLLIIIVIIDASGLVCKYRNFVQAENLKLKRKHLVARACALCEINAILLSYRPLEGNSNFPQVEL